ncbi:MAG: beta-N-acetylhexosaminidase [Pseudomonadota bacterium]
MTLGPVMLDVEGLALSPADRRLLMEPAVGGVILFRRNFESPEQLGELTAEIRALRQPELLIAVDQEGGRVQRLVEPMTRLPPLRWFGRRYDQEPQAARSAIRETSWLLGSELAAVGIDFSFTPVVDLDWGVSGVIGDRSLHADPRVVAELALELMRGLRDAGMAAVAKHFPGHGGVTADSHEELPVDRREWSALLDDMQPYQRLIAEGLPAIMTAHVVYPNCDPQPASFSRWWLTDVLRQRLGFGGAIFSDDLSMQAASELDPPDVLAQRALAAGCDMVLVCNQRRSAERVVAALGSKSSALSHARVARLRRSSTTSWAELRTMQRWQTAVATVDTWRDRPLLELDA